MYCCEIRENSKDKNTEFCHPYEPHFLRKVDGKMWFAAIKSDALLGLRYIGNSKTRMSCDAHDTRNYNPATMNLFVFDGMKVYKYEHSFPAEALINEVRSTSWLSQNPILNKRGWEPGWRNASDFDEILPLRADQMTPCYLPRDTALLTGPTVTLHSYTSDKQPASFSVHFEKK